MSLSKPGLTGFTLGQKMSDRKTLIKPSEIKNRLGSWYHVATEIRNGLDGYPFSWTDGERVAYTEKARAMGVTLVTQNWLKKNGYRLRRGAKHVGTAYFKAPISNTGKLYVLECHAVKVDEEDKS